MYELIKRTHELIRQKRKWFAKTQELSNLYLLYDRIFQTEEEFWKWTAFIEDLFLHYSIHEVLTWILDPFEIEPFNFEFELDLPSLDEFLQGILIKIRKITIDWDYDYFIEQFIKEFYKKFFERKPGAWLGGKARYCISPYDRSFYDPTLFLNFVTSTLPHYLATRRIRKTGEEITDTMVDLKVMHEYIADNFINRYELLHRGIVDTFILGYSILGVSRLSKKVVAGKRIYVEMEGDWRKIGKEKAYTHTLDPLIYGQMLGLTVLGISKLNPPVENQDISAFKEDMLKYVWSRVEKTISRYYYTPQVLFNYTTLEERRDYWKSVKTELYAYKQTLRYIFYDIVDKVLDKYNISQYDRMKYKSAIIQLLFHRGKKWGWGLKLFTQEDFDQVVEVWKRYWERQGINTAILDEILRICLTSLKQLARGLEKERLKKLQRLQA